MPKKVSKPAYTRHSSGQARVRIDGKVHYLGKYGSPESRERYDDLIAEWLARQDTSRVTLAVDDLSLLFLEHARGYYRRPDGTATPEITSIQHALRQVVAMHARTRARDFGPKALKEVRQSLIDGGHCRTNINRMVGRVKRMFRWAVEEELIPETVHRALCAVAGLKKGRTKARESEPVACVPEGTVSATLPHLPGVVADMVRLQLLTGARPGEVCAMRPCDVTIGTDGVWTYRPASHKTEHHGRERRIFIGPQGQDVLRPYLDRDPEAHCFSPAEAEAERNAKRRENRKSPMTPSQAARKPKGRKLRDSYTKDSYNRAISRACEQAKVSAWSPNQLRHSRATIIRERYGIEAAQVVLGHSDPRVTEIYAERDFAAAARIMQEIG